jgi:hypothetical protein
VEVSGQLHASTVLPSCDTDFHGSLVWPLELRHFLPPCLFFCRECESSEFHWHFEFSCRTWLCQSATSRVLLPTANVSGVQSGALLLLGAFAKLWKATVSFFMSVSLAVYMENFCSHRTHFLMKLHICGFFEKKTAEKIQLWLNTDKNIRYRGADKSLARPERKQGTAREDFDVHISYLLS